jgi:hypothetical protein
LYRTQPPLQEFVVLGGLKVIVLSLDLRSVGSISAEDDMFLKSIKICSRTFIGGTVKPSAPCRKVLRHDKEHYEYESDTY